jgi:hypothetical protein
MSSDLPKLQQLGISSTTSSLSCGCSFVAGCVRFSRSCEVRHLVVTELSGRKNRRAIN